MAATVFSKTVEFDFEFKCGGCGVGLDVVTEAPDYRGAWFLRVTPCEGCMAAAKSEGEEEGLQRGLKAME